MPLQSIVVVFLRLFAVQCFFSGIISLFPIWGRAPWIYHLLSASGWLLAVCLCWFFAEPLARFVAKNHNEPIHLGTLTRQDLYCFAFVFVGLGCFLYGLTYLISDCGVLIAHSMAGSMAGGIVTSDVENAVSQLPKQAVQSLLGLLALLFANSWSKKLIALEK